MQTQLQPATMRQNKGTAPITVGYIGPHLTMLVILGNRHLSTFHAPLKYQQSPAIRTAERILFFLLELTAT